MLLRLFMLSSVTSIVAACLAADPHPARRQQVTSSPDNSPVVTKVEPPNWWLRLTPELIVLLSGRHLEATGVACNLTNLVVERTQATASGDYLFLWLQFGAELQSVTALWLTPIVKNGATQDYHGYGAVDLYAVEPHLGSLRDYQELVAAAHQQHMKILFDIVPNHVGPKHPWAAKAPLADWFHGTVQHHMNASAPVSGAIYGEPESQGHDLFEAIVDPHAPPRLWRNLTEGRSEEHTSEL